jgi:hypothetical protein
MGLAFGLAALLVGSLVVCFLLVYHLRPPHEEAEEPAAAGLDAARLYQQFLDNPVGAREQHTGKVRVVTGRIEFIRNDGMVALAPGVACHFKEEQQREVARLRPGQRLTVRGYCGELLGPVGLRFIDCEVVK